VIPFLISVLAEAVSFQVSLILFPLFAVIGFLLVCQPDPAKDRNITFQPKKLAAG
jgi:hypothetical protein